jgi:hypothetical protein
MRDRLENRRQTLSNRSLTCALALHLQLRLLPGDVVQGLALLGNLLLQLLQLRAAGLVDLSKDLRREDVIEGTTRKGDKQLSLLDGEILMKCSFLPHQSSSAR